MKVEGHKHDVKKRLLKGPLRKGEDFSEELLKSTGGRPAKQIMLTVECFKMLCAQAQNDRGKEVLRCLLIIERLWKLYMETEFKRQQDQLTQAHRENAEIKKENSSLKMFKYNNARRWTYFKYKKGLCLYVIESGERYEHGKEIYKFGISVEAARQDESGDVNQRIGSHRSLWPNLKLKLLIYTPHSAILEKNLKHMNMNSEIIEIKLDDLTKRIFSMLTILSDGRREYELGDVELYNRVVEEPELTPAQERIAQSYKEILGAAGKYSVEELKEKLREFKLHKTGNKEVLKSRLKSHLEMLIENIREDVPEDLIDSQEPETRQNEPDEQITPETDQAQGKQYTIRDLVPKRLTREQIIDLTREIEDQHYCNGWCQSLLPLDCFHRHSRGYHDLCRKCRSLYSKADKKIQKGELTVDQIRENPWIVEPKLQTKSADTKMCNECKEWKSVSDFEPKKRKCKICRRRQADKRNAFDCQIFVAKMPSLDLRTKESELTYLPKDRLTILMKFLNVKRSSDDRKASMIQKLVAYFAPLDQQVSN